MKEPSIFRVGLDDLGNRCLLSTPGIELRFLGRPTHTLVAMPTALSLLFIFMNLHQEVAKINSSVNRGLSTFGFNTVLSYLPNSNLTTVNKQLLLKEHHILVLGSEPCKKP